MNQTTNITPSLVRSVKPSDKLITIRDTGQPGLQLRISVGGSKTWYLDFRNREGKRVSFRIGTIKTHTVNEARNAARIHLGEIARGKDPQAAKQAAREADLAAKQAAQSSESRTLSAYLSGPYGEHLRHTKSGNEQATVLKAVFADILEKDMADLRIEDVESIMKARANAGISPATLARDRTRLMALLNHAVHRGTLTENPLRRWKRPQFSDEHRIRWLNQYDPGELERFYGALSLETQEVRTICLMALNTGMRRNEILSLKWCDIDFKARSITIRSEVAKSWKSRTVWMNDDVLILVDDWRKQVDHAPMSWVFPTVKKDGTPGRVVAIQSQWSRVVKNARLIDFRFHDLRHTCASKMVQSGVPLAVVKEVLGHSDMSVTLRYAHLSTNDVSTAMRNLKF